MTWVARVIVERPDEEEPTAFDLSGATLFGRKPPSDVCIPIAQMSSTHIWLRVHPDGGVTIEDAGSTSGVYVDEQLCHGIRRITSANVIKFGGVTLRLAEVIDDKTV